MKLVFYSVVLNHHQAPMADEFYKLLGVEYCFVELIKSYENKGASDNYSNRPYLLRAWESPENYEKAMALAKNAECCVFSGVQSLPYMKERMRIGLLSFDMGERWLKQGLKNVFSPAISKMALAYYLNGWKHKPLYKLCMSAFAADDHARLDMYKGKCFKWGYFTKVESFDIDDKPKERPEKIKIMWCARFIDWKHPELALRVAVKLKDRGCNFHLDMYGEGIMRSEIELFSKCHGTSDCVSFHGNVPNEQIRQAMREHDIFLFTSDRDEGWGAVANEAMSEGCLLIGSNEIGAVPYLVQDHVNGMIFNSCDLQSLFDKVTWAIEHPSECLSMRNDAINTMKNLWSPRIAAKSLLALIDNLKRGKDTPFKEGPCSKA